jgi:two-component system, OmpR family, sensor histidine kinase VicK
MNKDYEEIKNYVLEKIAQSQNHLFFIFDFGRKTFVELNGSFEKVFEEPTSTIKQRPEILWEMVHEDDKTFVMDFFKETIARLKKEQKVDFRIKTLSGRLKFISANIFLIEKGSDEVFISGFAQDISEYKAFEQTLFEVSAKKNSALEILSHDLTGPLTMVQNLSYQIQQQCSMVEMADVNMYADLITDTCERAIRMIKSLVNHEFLASSEVTLNIDRLDLVYKINDLILFYKKSEQHILKQFRFNSSVDKIFVEIDEIKLIQVINNLISNAIKFTHDNGIIEISLQETEDSVLIICIDNGIGIPAKDQEFVFDKFTKARRNGLKGEESVGLGLSIVKKIVELHKGKIWFESEENKGTSFFVEIPKKLHLRV